MTNWKFTILLLNIIFFSQTLGEYRKLIPTCANSCLTSGENNSPTNCFCDSKCSLVYNDCCLDAPTRSFRGTTKRGHNCVFVHGENRHFWMVDKCKDSWTGHGHVREKCMESDVVSGESNDIIGALPVTNAEEGVTYKNYYCSICNGVDSDSLVEWQMDHQAWPPTINSFCSSKCSLVSIQTRTFRGTTMRGHNCVFVYGENIHFWMVDKCKDSWTGHGHVREKCMESDVVSGESNDIIGALPVTNAEEGVTYKNYYCSICNEVDADSLIEWQVKALCNDEDINQEDILRNLTFKEDQQQWGVWKWNPEDQGWSFHQCYLLFQAPSNLTDGVRQCHPSMVSTCPRSWTNMSTRRKCNSYVDPVRWSDGPVFRNMDCAVCHNRTRDGYKCVYDVARGTNAIMLSRTMSVDLSSMGQWF